MPPPNRNVSDTIPLPQKNPLPPPRTAPKPGTLLESPQPDSLLRAFCLFPGRKRESGERRPTQREARAIVGRPQRRRIMASQRLMLSRLISEAPR